MSISITIRSVPEEARDRLAARAALTGRSLQDYVRGQLIELAQRPSAEELMAQVRDRKRRTGSRLPAKAILKHRAAERR